MSVGMLTGHPAEHMPGSTGELLPELSQLHKRVRQVLQGVAQALWPSISMPQGLGELAEKLKGARRRLPIIELSIGTKSSNSKNKKKNRNVKLPYQFHSPIALCSPATAPE